MHECLICKSKNTVSNKTKVSKFLCSRMLDGKQKDTYLIYCKDCGFSYYDFRPSDEEMKKFYLGYRNEEYQKQRQASECWYTPQINELIGKNTTEAKNREKNLTEIINKCVDLNKITNVLDYGGDMGQHIPHIFSDKKKYVFDISEVEPVEGVTALKDFSKINGFDFIMCSGLLEHISNPVEITERIISLMNKGGYLYVEIPFDSPFYTKKTDSLQFLFNKYYSLKNIIQYYIETKKENIIKPMHEHINFFTLQAVNKLLSDLGLEIVYSDMKKIDFKWCKGKTISVLARKNI